MLKRLLLASVLTAGFVAATTSNADAAVILMVGSQTITDGGTADSNPGANQITYFGSGTTFTSSINTGVFATGPYLDVASQEITSKQAGSLVIKFTVTDLTSPTFIANYLSKFSGNISGTTTAGAKAELVTYYDPNNAQFGTTTLLSDLTGTGTYGLTGSAPGGGKTPFSLTEVLTITASAAGQSFSVDGSLTPVPEPISLVVLGVGLAGVGMVRHRRKA